MQTNEIRGSNRKRYKREGMKNKASKIYWSVLILIIVFIIILSAVMFIKLRSIDGLHSISN
jgi:hypothetical protein